MKNFAPLSILETSLGAIYEDENGNLKEFSLEYERREVEKSDGGNKYKTEEIDVNLLNSSEDYYLNIYISSNKISDIANEFIVSSLYTSINNGLIPSIKIDENGQAILCQMVNTISLNGKEYKNVYLNFSNPINNSNSFEFIYFTKELGIIGFKDQNGSLWLLKEYK